MKKIGIDCSKLNTSRKTGTHRFLIGFLNQLTKNKEFEYTFYFNEFDKSYCNFEFLKRGKTIILSNKSFYTQIHLLKELDKFDYFLFPWQTIPFLSIFRRVKILSIIHDEGYSFISKLTTFLTILMSDKVFSVSNSTASKIFRESIVINEGVDTSIFKKVPISEINEFKTANSIPDFFILSLGRIEKRKNIYNNLLAFSKVQKFYPKLKYIFVGEFKINEEKIYSFIKKNNLPRESIIFLNYISDKDLNLLLNMMEFMIFTSFNEGFGLPVLESYAVSKPVILSRIEQLAELSLIANQISDPYSTDDIAQKIIYFLKNKNIIQKSAYKGILEKYSWENSVKTFIMNL